MHAVLPPLDAAGIDDLERVTAGSAEQPRGVFARTFAISGGQQVQQVVVVAHEHEESAVDDWGVVEVCVGRPCHERRHRGIEDGGVAEARVSIAGGECARHRAATARASEASVDERWCFGRVGVVFFG